MLIYGYYFNFKQSNNANNKNRANNKSGIVFLNFGIDFVNISFFFTFLCLFNFESFYPCGIQDLNLLTLKITNFSKKNF